jgi:hypothetical protein
MRVRRPVLLSVAVAACLSAALALIGPASSHSGPPRAVASAAHAFVAENVLVATPVGRIAPTWADRHGDERHARTSADALATLAFSIELVACGVVIAGVLLAARQRSSALVHVRGPPRFELV